MVADGAMRNGELIADLSSECHWLGKAQVMRVAGSLSTDEAGLSRDKLEVMLVTEAPQLHRRALGDGRLFPV